MPPSSRSLLEGVFPGDIAIIRLAPRRLFTGAEWLFTYGTAIRSPHRRIAETVMCSDAAKTSLTLVEKSNTALIASVDEAGFPTIKAMLKPREHDGLKTFYFTTNTSSMRVTHFTGNPKASIYFYDARLFQGLLLRGTMEVLQDEATKQKIWRDGDTMYYSQGVNDPDYCVLRFTAKNARLYQSFGSEDFDVVLD